MKNRVTGIGGVFFKTPNPEKTRDWYEKHLGIESDKYGGQFIWRKDQYPNERAITAWSPMKDTTDYFAPSTSTMMINYRVENLLDLLSELKAEGVKQVGQIEEFEYGKFAWIMDLDGNKIELWEPIDEPFLK